MWFSADKIVIRANRYGKLKPELGDKLIRLGTRLRARYESLVQDER